jgi:hypothetical protein
MLATVSTIKIEFRTDTNVAGRKTKVVTVMTTIMLESRLSRMIKSAVFCAA